MPDPRPRGHWISEIVHRLALVGADVAPLAASTPLAEAWRTTARSCGRTEEQLAAVVAGALRLDIADFTAAQAHATALVPEKLARERQVFALRETDQRITVATANPNDMEAEQLVAFASGRRVVLEVAPPMAILEALDARYAPERAVERLLTRVGDDIANHVLELDEPAPQVVTEREAESAPIIKLTHVILGDAVRARASDIHLEPSTDGGRVRFRIDGVLQPYTRLSVPILSRVVSRLKIMGKMDIADHFRPQDGRARIRVDDRAVDLRISTIPTREAEKAVVRLLDAGKGLGLEELSLEPADIASIRALLGRRDGIVLVTGPTGSGKTTLLYAALREMPTGELNIMTVEDPVEYDLGGLTQIQVEPKRGVTFASALRSILRQDPDVIFIGEIRDAETAGIAVQASLTGHLVLASLHTNDAVGSVARFADLGVDRSEMASTLRGATAQRLIRRVCAHCAQRITGPLSESEQKLANRYGVSPVVRAIGCPRCSGTGYYGRIPLLEVLIASPAFEARILDGASASALQAAATAAGMRPLRAAAVERVRNGETTIDEIDRELGESDPVAEAAQSAVAHILVVDDDDVARATAVSLLSANGFRVSEATTGAAALTIADHERDLALVVLDHDMPGMTGFDVLRRLREAVPTSTLPVLVLTGTTDADTEEAMMDAGADDYVRKPLHPGRFLARVKAVLKRAAQ